MTQPRDRAIIAGAMSARAQHTGSADPLRHAAADRPDGDLAKETRAFHDASPSVRFMTDVLRALHAGAPPVRTPAEFCDAFPPRLIMDSFAQRADLRARVAHAVTGGPHALLRRIAPGDLAAQIDLLLEEDIPIEERNVRAEPDRLLGVAEILAKYLEPADLAAYVPLADLWSYESRGQWWETATPSTRALAAAELKSIRRHALATDTELLDRIGNATLEERLPVAVRVKLREAARKAAADGRAFTDTDTFECVRGGDVERDLVDELVEHVSLDHLRSVIRFVAARAGLCAPAASDASAQSAASSSSLKSSGAGGASASIRPPPGGAGAGRAASPGVSTSVRPPPPGLPGGGRAPSIPPPAPPPTPKASVIRDSVAPLPGPREPAAPISTQARTGNLASTHAPSIVDDESYGTEVTSDTVEPAPARRDEFDDSATTQVGGKPPRSKR